MIENQGTAAHSKITLSIDWEDFGQLFGKYHHDVISEPLAGAIERQTNIILDMLDETGNRATFFILGMLARYRSGLVRKIASRGHEIGLHGQNHETMFSLSPKAARIDLEDAYKVITDITGSRVYGYRAPFFSINKTNLYVLEMLSDLGLTYDSSIFPIKLPRYGIDNFDEKDALYKLPNGREIVELPLTVFSFLGGKLPVSGGGYIRLMPNWLIKKIFHDLDEANISSMIYMHPYEFDTEQIDVSSNYPNGVSRSTLKIHAQNFRWNLFRNSVRCKIKHLLTRYQFITCLERAIDVKSEGNSSELLG